MSDAEREEMGARGRALVARAFRVAGDRRGNGGHLPLAGRQRAEARIRDRVMKYRVAFLSVVPSPYQRDIFAALARRDDVDLRVYYLEAAAPDSPWPEKPLPDYSRMLAGSGFPSAQRAAI